MRLKISTRPLRSLACALVLAAAAPVAFAAPPSDAQVDELMDVMRVEQTLDGMWPQVQAMQQQAAAQAAAGKDLTAGEQAEIQAMLDRMMGIHRMLLHARRLAFAHPAHGGMVEVTAPVDAPFQRALDLFDGGRDPASQTETAGAPP